MNNGNEFLFRKISMAEMDLSFYFFLVGFVLHTNRRYSWNINNRPMENLLIFQSGSFSYHVLDVSSAAQFACESSTEIPFDLFPINCFFDMPN